MSTVFVAKIWIATPRRYAAIDTAHWPGLAAPRLQWTTPLLLSQAVRSTSKQPVNLIQRGAKVGYCHH